MTKKISIALLLCSIMLVPESNTMESLNSINFEQCNNNQNNIDITSNTNQGEVEQVIPTIEQFSNTMETKQKEFNEFINQPIKIITDEDIINYKQNIIDIYKDFILLKSTMSSKQKKKKLHEITNNVYEYITNIKKFIENNNHINNNIQDIIYEYIIDNIQAIQNSSNQNKRDLLVAKYSQLHHCYIWNTLFLIKKNNELCSKENSKEVEWFITHIQNNIYNIDNYNGVKKKQDDQYKNLIVNIENNIQLLNPNRDNVLHTMTSTNSIYESSINKEFFNAITNKIKTYDSLAEKITHFDMIKYTVKLKQDYNKLLSILNKYINNINQSNKEEILQAKAQKEDEYFDKRYQDIVNIIDGQIREMNKYKEFGQGKYDDKLLSKFEQMFEKRNIQKYIAKQKSQIQIFKQNFESLDKHKLSQKCLSEVNTKIGHVEKIINILETCNDKLLSKHSVLNCWVDENKMNCMLDSNKFKILQQANQKILEKDPQQILVEFEITNGILEKYKMYYQKILELTQHPNTLTVKDICTPIEEHGIISVLRELYVLCNGADNNNNIDNNGDLYNTCKKICLDDINGSITSYNGKNVFKILLNFAFCSLCINNNNKLIVQLTNNKEICKVNFHNKKIFKANFHDMKSPYSIYEWYNKFRRILNKPDQASESKLQNITREKMLFDRELMNFSLRVINNVNK